MKNRSSIRNINIPKRLIISFLIASITPLLIIGGVVYQKSSEAVKSKISAYSVEIVDQISKAVTDENKKYSNLVSQISFDSTVQESLKNYKRYDSFSRMEVQRELNTILSEKWELLQHVRSIYIQTSDGTYFYDLGFDLIPSQDVERLITIMESSDQSEVWDEVTTSKGRESVVIARPIVNGNDWSSLLGHIFIAVDKAAYEHLLKPKGEIGNNTDMLILDVNGEVLIGGTSVIQTDGQLPPNVIEQLNDQLSAQNYRFDLNTKTGSYMITYAYEAYSSWYLINMIPHRYLNEESVNIRNSILVMALVSIVLSLFLTLSITRSIAQPLKKLVKSMNEFAKGNLNASLHDPHSDELAQISLRFNSMVHQIRELVNERELASRQKREAEIQVLQAQINPHFLFNTLNSLKWTAALSQVNSVSDGIGALAELLRNTIVDKNEYVTLRDEINNLKNYIIIQRMRYGDSFEVNFHIDESLLPTYILKLMLQPIVENAIIHGIDSMDSGAQILITAAEHEGKLVLKVSDNGKGMSKQQVEKLLNGPVSSHKRLCNIGISNVKERILLHYGNQYGLVIDSLQGQGTTVTIALPLMENTQGGNSP
ncbi:cache domain-containing sensor histidine kinase [Paenibacillus faecalis]|uniref:cache domain-containing sensor histidine kinase n=1 Tax=Paenibacillus faecalis TaxID=2079532 RepID=UPI000D1049F9|nr:sensor histidine kinase [Paenibacillus faecalis]